MRSYDTEIKTSSVIDSTDAGFLLTTTHLLNFLQDILVRRKLPIKAEELPLLLREGLRRVSALEPHISTHGDSSTVAQTSYDQTSQAAIAQHGNPQSKGCLELTLMSIFFLCGSIGVRQMQMGEVGGGEWVQWSDRPSVSLSVRLEVDYSVVCR